MKFKTTIISPSSIIPLIPFIILEVRTVITWIQFQNSDLEPTMKHFIGAVLVMATLVALLIKRRVGMILTVVTLLLITFNVAAFTPAITTHRVRIGIMLPEVQLAGLGLLILFIILNIKPILRFLRISIPEIPETGPAEKKPEA